VGWSSAGISSRDHGLPIPRRADNDRAGLRVPPQRGAQPNLHGVGPQMDESMIPFQGGLRQLASQGLDGGRGIAGAQQVAVTGTDPQAQAVQLLAIVVFEQSGDDGGWNLVSRIRRRF
jgi:hypothetical protein